MGFLHSSSLFPFLLVFIVSFSWPITSSADIYGDFLHCLSSSSISNLVYTQMNSSYSSILESTIHNSRFITPTSPKPWVIVTPLHVSHVQATIRCSKIHGLQLRTRSGGHDFEGVSYISESESPFVIIDLANLRSVQVDVENEVAWVQSGAIMGEFGGGYGLLFRKYGLAADNVIDAEFIDANGRILNRKSMGEDLFWAIRGGGGGSFGIVLSWKIKLVHVGETVTVFSISKTLEQNATQILHRWQYISYKFPDGMYPSITISTTNTTTQDGRNLTVVVTFSTMFLGRANELVLLMQNIFSELGLTSKDCNEMSFVESILALGLLPNQNLEILLDRNYRVSFLVATPSFKTKSDYVKKPIPEIGFQGIWSQLLEPEARGATFNFVVKWTNSRNLQSLSHIGRGIYTK
ncbi:berberine bridge enzyme-like 8 [Gossypium hirsutum]|uniref:Berberine bridge enzyme-like 8 n=1 Tax=Gossypium hirsutum TaxID=3635 RepID=A0ABM2YNQ4_GOSHI|nr:berberine bridge enzyme-like 8 [Gossypium hirsutum]